MMRYISFRAGFLAGLLLFSAASIFADQAEMPNQTELPLEFSADLLEAFSQEHRILLTGHVSASQGDWTLTAERMIIKYTDKPATPQKTVSSDKNLTTNAAREIETLTAEGDVIVTFQDSVARTPKAVYHQTNGLLTLEGTGTELNTPESRISGHRITVNRATGHISVERSPDTPVKGVFTRTKATDGDAGLFAQ